MARAILQYRNTPRPDDNLSPAQITFHRVLRDHIPMHPAYYRIHPEWAVAAKLRENANYQRYKKLQVDYNRSSKLLPIIKVGSTVIIQNARNNRWGRTARVVEINPFRKYTLRMDGSGRICTHNPHMSSRSASEPTRTIGTTCS